MFLAIEEHGLNLNISGVSDRFLLHYPKTPSCGRGSCGQFRDLLAPFISLYFPNAFQCFLLTNDLVGTKRCQEPFIGVRESLGIGV